MPTDTLNLSTISLATVDDLPVNGVEVDGEFYPYANVHEWGLLDRAAFRRHYVAALEAEGVTDPDDDAQDRYSRDMRELTRLLVPTLPAQVARSLSDAKQGAIHADALIRFGGTLQLILPPKHAQLWRVVREVAGSLGVFDPPDVAQAGEPEMAVTP